MTHYTILLLRGLLDRYPSTDNEKLEATREFAEYLRKTSWKFGDCDNDLVIVVSKSDRTVRHVYVLLIIYLVRCVFT